MKWSEYFIRMNHRKLSKKTLKEPAKETNDEIERWN